MSPASSRIAPPTRISPRSTLAAICRRCSGRTAARLALASSSVPSRAITTCFMPPPSAPRHQLDASAGGRFVERADELVRADLHPPLAPEVPDPHDLEPERPHSSLGAIDPGERPGVD